MNVHSASFLNSGHLVTGRSWTKVPHRHPFHQFIVMLQGRFLVRMGDGEIDAGKADVLFYPAGVEHRERIDPSDPAEFIYLGWESMGQEDLPVTTADRRGRIRVLAEWLRDEEQRSSYADKGAVLDSLVGALLEEYRRCAHHREDALAFELRAYVREHLAEPLGLDQLAAALGMNKFTVLRRCRRSTGVTPMAEVRRLRVETARELIVSSDDTLAAIAAKVGIGDERQLSRLFKKRFGVPPGYFRKP